MWHFDRPGIIEIINFLVILHFNSLNNDISVNMHVITLKFSMYILKVVLEGRVSQICQLGTSFCFIKKSG